jgi:hypothetical protein
MKVNKQVIPFQKNYYVIPYMKYFKIIGYKHFVDINTPKSKYFFTFKSYVFKIYDIAIKGYTCFHLEINNAFVFLNMGF